MKIKLIIAAATLISSQTFATEVFIQDGGLTVRTELPACTQVGAAKVCRTVLVAPAPEQPEETVVASAQEQAPANNQTTPEPTPEHITYFAFDSANVSKTEQKALKKVVPNLKESNILVAGFADPLGSDEYNQKLVQERAENVKKYLSKNGIAKDKIKAIGVGKAQNPNCETLKSKAETIKCFAKQRAAYIFKQ